MLRRAIVASKQTTASIINVYWPTGEEGEERARRRRVVLRRARHLKPLDAQRESGGDRLQRQRGTRDGTCRAAWLCRITSQLTDVATVSPTSSTHFTPPRHRLDHLSAIIGLLYCSLSSTSTSCLKKAVAGLLLSNWNEIVYSLFRNQMQQ